MMKTIVIVRIKDRMVLEGIRQNVSDTSQISEYSNATSNIILLENHHNNANNASGDGGDSDDDEAPSFHCQPQRQPQDNASSFHNSFAPTVIFQHFVVSIPYES